MALKTGQRALAFGTASGSAVPKSRSTWPLAMAHREIQSGATKKIDAGPFGIWLSASFLPLQLLAGFELLTFERQTDGPQCQS
jgi:hypothetical protein